MNKEAEQALLEILLEQQIYPLRREFGREIIRFVSNHVKLLYGLEYLSDLKLVPAEVKDMEMAYSNIWDGLPSIPEKQQEWPLTLGGRVAFSALRKGRDIRFNCDFILSLRKKAFLKCAETIETHFLSDLSAPRNACAYLKRNTQHSDPHFYRNVRHAAQFAVPKMQLKVIMWMQETPAKPKDEETHYVFDISRTLKPDFPYLDLFQDYLAGMALELHRAYRKKYNRYSAIEFEYTRGEYLKGITNDPHSYGLPVPFVPDFDPATENPPDGCMIYPDDEEDDVALADGNP